MTDKSQYVDLISEATEQNRRRRASRIARTVGVDAPEEQQERRLSNWPPGRFAQWRLENLAAWKLKVKSWKFKDWG